MPATSSHGLQAGHRAPMPQPQPQSDGLKGWLSHTQPVPSHRSQWVIIRPAFYAVTAVYACLINWFRRLVKD